jgi:hypothetical protein
MEKRGIRLAVAAALIVSACEVTTRAAVDNEVLELDVGGDRLVCHVRNIAAAQGLSFHHGTYSQGSELMTTFRLIGDDYEITMINPNTFSYDLSVYDMSPDGTARARAIRAYHAFREALVKQPVGECVT